MQDYFSLSMTTRDVNQISALGLAHCGDAVFELMVRERLTTEEGYVAGRQEQNAYIGKVGVAATTLRPAGTVELEDGTRIDVVTAGEFIEKGEPVQVVRKDGTWLVVEKRRTKE